MRHKGFTFIEIMVVVSIVVLLSAIAAVSLSAMQERLLLRSAVSDIAFALEAARAHSVAGTGGDPHGVYFGENVFVEFSGSAYDDEDPDNVTHEIDDRLLLATDILGGEGPVIFSRIVGTVDDGVTITVSSVSNPSLSRSITVGAGGDIAFDE